LSKEKSPLVKGFVSADETKYQSEYQEKMLKALREICLSIPAGKAAEIDTSLISDSTVKKYVDRLALEKKIPDEFWVRRLAREDAEGCYIVHLTAEEVSQLRAKSRKKRS